jgi:hypothetical protein
VRDALFKALEALVSYLMLELKPNEKEYDEPPLSLRRHMLGRA